MEPPILAIDPGRDKCGLAVLNHEQGVLWHGVVATAELLPVSRELSRQYRVRAIVLGNQTFSRDVRRMLQPLLEQKLAPEIILVDERGSTEMARTRYWQAFPPSGWRRFIPRGLLVPPCAIDDFAAIILGERFLAKKS
jgi:RNase H-fold protein (predicted Holliday junction resolvase)